MTKETSMKDRELLAWAAAEVQKAQGDKLHGTVTFIFHDGNLVRAETKAISLPEKS